jgi:PAS domain S-box-containing protein
MATDPAIALRLPTADIVATWLRGRRVVIAALIVVLVIVTIATSFVVLQRKAMETSALERVDLYSHVIQDHVERTLGTADVAMRALSENLLDRLDDLEDPGGAERLLAGSLVALPYLRSLSLLDIKGRVLVSTQAENLQLDVPVARWAIAADATRTILGPYEHGRDLADLATGSNAVLVSFVPLVRQLSDRHGRHLLLVATLNLDYFATQNQLLLGDEVLQAALFAYDGRLLVATDRIAAEPGQRPRNLRIFDELLPKTEHQRLLGSGVDGNGVAMAFRTLRQWPVVVVVEMPQSEITAALRSVISGTAVVAVVTLLLLGVVGAVALRSLRRHELVSSELRIAHEAVVTSETRKWAILKTAVDGIISVDAQGHIVDFNPAAEKMFGRRFVDVAGRAMHELIIPQRMRQSHLDGMARFQKTGHGPVISRRIEIEGMRADGHSFPIELTIVPVRSGDEQFFTATIRDITERKQVDAERKRLIRRYRRVASALERQKLALDEHAIVSITDHDGKIVYANERLALISGHPREALIGRKHNIFRSGLHPNAFYDELWGTIKSGGVWNGEIVNRRADGTLYWVACTIVPLPGEDEQPGQFISVQTDISKLRVAEQALAQARLAELQVGNRIQQSLLVTRPPAQSAGLWMTAYNHASQVIDGDFVDVIPTGDHRIDIVVGDVMGKGLPAALLGAATKLQFSRSMAELTMRGPDVRQTPSPSEIVASVHLAMTPHLQALDAFVTLCYLRIDTRAGRLTWVGCGHEEPIICSRDGGDVRRLANQHPPLGVLERMNYAEETIPLGRGEFVFMASDGLTDAIRPDGERVGHERVLQSLRRVTAHRPTPAAAMHLMRRELLSDGVRLTDDMTLVLLMRVDRDSDRRIEVANSLASLRNVREFVVTQARVADLSEVEAGLLEVATVEAFTNIVRHARGLPEGAPVEIISHVDRGQLELELVYIGDAIALPAVAEPDLSRFPEGGFGMSIMESVCDRVDYLHTAGVNTVRIVKAAQPI